MSIRLSKIALRASIEEIPKREKLQNREGGFFHSFNRRVGHPRFLTFPNIAAMVSSHRCTPSRRKNKVNLSHPSPFTKT